MKLLKQFPNRIHIQTIVSEPDTTYSRIEKKSKNIKPKNKNATPPLVHTASEAYEHILTVPVRVKTKTLGRQQARIGPCSLGGPRSGAGRAGAPRGAGGGGAGAYRRARGRPAPRPAGGTTRSACASARAAARAPTGQATSYHRHSRLDLTVAVLVAYPPIDLITRLP